MMQRRKMMYHEHPLRILKYSVKYIWLLIFPLLRGIRSFSLDVNAAYSWIKGAWFDIMVIGLIIIFGLIRWYCSRITITDGAIIHTDGLFFRVRRTIPYSNLSSVTIEKPFYLMPFGGMKIYCNTCAGIFQSTDMKLMVNRRVCSEFMRHVPRVDSKNGVRFRNKPRLSSVLLFSVFFSSSFSGAVYLAAFFFKGGDIARDMIAVSLERITAETSKAALSLIRNIPDAAIGIGSFFLMTWFLSFSVNILRYAGFVIRSDWERFEVRYGTFTKRDFIINADQINYVDLRQNFVMKLFKAVTVNISCAGYGVTRSQLPVLFPIQKNFRLGEGLEHLGLNTGSKAEFRPSVTSIWQYIWSPVVVSAAISTAYRLIGYLFPQFSELAFFVMIMAEIPSIWMILVKSAAAATSSIAVYDENIMIRCCRGFTFHTVIAERSRLVKMQITQTPFQRFFGKCTVSLSFNGEVSRRHSVKAIKVRYAAELSRLLGHSLICA